MADQLERDPVTVVDDPGPARRQRVGSGDILAAIRALPDAVAARLDGHRPDNGNGDDGGAPAEVTFVGDPPPVPAPEPATGAAPSPAPVVSRPVYHHPSRRARRTELIA
jgi:hypothetical protein